MSVNTLGEIMGYSRQQARDNTSQASQQAASPRKTEAPVREEARPTPPPPTPRPEVKEEAREVDYRT